jgi:molybdopterin biosynthesis enzyme
MTFIRNNALFLTAEDIAHRFNTRHDEDIVVMSDAVLVLGGVTTGRLEVQSGGLVVVAGMLLGSLVVQPGARVLIAEGAWAALPGNTEAWPLIGRRFIDPVLNQIGNTSVNDFSMLRIWDGTGVDTLPTGEAFRTYNKH